MMLIIPVAGMEDLDGMEIDYVASFILFVFLFSLVVELIRVNLLSLRCGEVFQILAPQFFSL